MTEAQAIQFLQSRKRSMAPTGHLSIEEVISRIKLRSWGMIFAAMSYIFIASINVENSSGFRLLLKVILIALSLCMIGNAIFGLVRLRQACRALNYATDGSSRLSGSK